MPAETPLIVVPKPAGPLIKIPRNKWVRDPGISELIDHFDSPELLKIKNREERFAKLTNAEITQISKVLERCRGEFQYAARNFFWITTKQRGEQLFALWEAQELILEYMMRLKAKGIAQRVLIIKARQLGCSTLIEALIAWRTMFFANVMAFVVADEPDRAARLFAIMQYIYDRMPWWLQPMCSARKYQDGLIFSNPNEAERRQNPGLNSQIVVNWANKTTGIAQGYTVNAGHVSEFPSFEENKAREIIEENFGPALAAGPETFAFLEGTAKGAGTYAHKLWMKSMDLGDDAKWFPKFMPWFFESGRLRPTEPDWEIPQPETEMRERVSEEWLRCDTPTCRQFHERWLRNEDRDGSTCPTCESGRLERFVLSDQQLAWMVHERKNAQGDAGSLDNLKQEFCTTAEEAFVISGQKVFSDAAQDWVSKNVRSPIASGSISRKLEFHGCDTRKKKITSVAGEDWFPCITTTCNGNHTFDKNQLLIWEFPRVRSRYVIGADVAEGLGGEGNYSVAFVVRIGGLGEVDEQVATFRSNEINRIDFADVLQRLGHFYNKALIAVETNRYDTAASWLQDKFLYPNCYRTRTPGTNNLSPKLGWETTERSKSRLYDTMRRWLEYREIKIHSRNFAEEMKTFKREDSGKAGKAVYNAARGTFDDELMAGMIALFVAHAGDYDENLGYVVMRGEVNMDNARWHMKCGSCAAAWPSSNVMDSNNCPKCGSIHISGNQNPEFLPSEPADPNEIAQSIAFYDKAWSASEGGMRSVDESMPVPDYDSF